MRLLALTRKFSVVFVRIALLALAGASTARAAETITFFHTDIAGTPMLATDSNGGVVWKETYRPYGDRLVEASTSENNKLWFTGKPFDESTGLSYYGARYYDPTLGRFMGIDPAAPDLNNIHSLNRYAYANNNPHRYVDPDGRIPVDTVWDFGNVIWDIGKITVGWTIGNQKMVVEGSTDLLLDAGAMLVPYMPAGTQKLARQAAGYVIRGAESGAKLFKAAESLVEAGKRIDRNGLSAAGRALQKHGDRAGSVFPASSGTAAARNAQGQEVLENILKSDNKQIRTNRFGGQDIFDSATGQGVRYDEAGNMMGFLDP
jgi:RHS repeat-associated protein